MILFIITTFFYFFLLFLHERFQWKCKVIITSFSWNSGKFSPLANMFFIYGCKTDSNIFSHKCQRVLTYIMTNLGRNFFFFSVFNDNTSFRVYFPFEMLHLIVPLVNQLNKCTKTWRSKKKLLHEKILNDWLPLPQETFSLFMWKKQVTEHLCTLIS